MSEKSSQKKKLIVENARGVFEKKGYKKVSMQDIVEASEISRGGLYLYFNNTQEVFLEVLKLDKESASEAELTLSLSNVSATDMMALFLKEQKKALLNEKESLCIAIYEFYFEHKLMEVDNQIKKDFDMSVMIIQKIIEKGIETGEFICEDSLATARNFVYNIEGMKIMSLTVGVTDNMIDTEFVYMIKKLVEG